MQLARLSAILALLSISGPSFASDKASGDWVYSLDNDLSEAWTASDSGAALGVLCSHAKNNCISYLRSNSTCDEGASYPILANGKDGAANLTATCRVLLGTNGKIHALILSPDDTVIPLIMGSGQLGFAQPMVDGQFRVYRFSLHGSASAIGNVADHSSKGTRDEEL